jgi:hypothetical protein
VGSAYTVRALRFRPGAASTLQTLTFEWDRQLTRLTTMTVSAGSILAGSRPSPEILISVGHRPRPLLLSASYTKTEDALIGVPGTVATQSLTASAEVTAADGLRLRFRPGAFRSVHAGQRADAARFAFEAERRLTGPVSVLAVYEATVQNGSFVTGASASMTRHFVQVGITAAPGSREPRRR